MGIFRYIKSKYLVGRKFGELGRSSIVYAPVILQNAHNIIIKDNSTILSGARMQSYQGLVNSSPKIKIGNNCYIGYNFSALAGANITIGNNVLIASNVLLSSENHSIDPISDLEYMNQPLIAAPIKIENGCWIGEKVIILPGVEIGQKSIIGAGSVVTKSIPAYSIAVGNPARIIKQYNFKTNQWEKII